MRRLMITLLLLAPTLALEAELARLDPKALEQLPKENRDLVPAKPRGAPPPAPPPNFGGGLPGLGGGPRGFPGLPGLGGGGGPFPGQPGKKK